MIATVVRNEMWGGCTRQAGVRQGKQAPVDHLVNGATRERARDADLLARRICCLLAVRPRDIRRVQRCGPRWERKKRPAAQALRFLPARRGPAQRVRE